MSIRQYYNYIILVSYLTEVCKFNFRYFLKHDNYISDLPRSFFYENDKIDQRVYSRSDYMEYRKVNRQTWEKMKNWSCILWKNIGKRYDRTGKKDLSNYPVTKIHHVISLCLLWCDKLTRYTHAGLSARGTENSTQSRVYISCYKMISLAISKLSRTHPVRRSFSDPEDHARFAYCPYCTSASTITMDILARSRSEVLQLPSLVLFDLTDLSNTRKRILDLFRPVCIGALW